MAEFTLLETNRQLALVCESLCAETELALDLEADSLHHYREKVCLLQLSSRTNTWLIDPLQVTELGPLASLLATPSLLTVFHGGDYDIRSLHRDFGITVANMFDTMIAAQFAGYTEFGLAALLRSNFAIELDKRFQKADWSKRPLTPEMADYAAHDTAHLLQLADVLREALQSLGRSAWVEEECALIAANRMAEKGGEPLFLRCKGAGKLRRRNLAILEELLQLRDLQARDLDRPPFKVMPAEALLTLAEKEPQSADEMTGIAGLSPKLLERYGSSLLAAVQRGQALPEELLPCYPRNNGDTNPGIKTWMSVLKRWRDEFSTTLKLSPGLIAPNWLLERLSEQRPVTVEQLAAVQGIRRWQVELWGNAVLSILTKEN